MNIVRLVLYIAAFGILSLGSKLIVDTISSFSKRLKIPPFVFSFFIVGIMTSVGEIAVGINALSIHQPEIFVGSLLGGTLVLFLVVIPLMALLNHGLQVRKHLSSKNLLVILGIIATPALFTLDRTITNTEAFMLIALYISLLYIIRTPPGTFAKLETVMKKETKQLRDNSILHLVIGGGMVFLASRFIVEQTLNYSSQLHISTFLVSLVVIAIGTNLPEISLALHASSTKQSKAQDIAIGDFLGSAAANVLLFGIFTLINNGDVITAKNFAGTFVCIVVALGSFFIFTYGKRVLTPKKGLLLIGFYTIFIASQFIEG